LDEQLVDETIGWYATVDDYMLSQNECSSGSLFEISVFLIGITIFTIFSYNKLQL